MNLINKLQTLQNHLLAKNYEYVINECEKIIKKNPNNSFVFNLCGLAYQGNKNILISIKYFKQAVYLDDANIAAKNNLANSYKSTGNLHLAENLYKEIIHKNPKHIQSLNNYGNLKQTINDYESAIEYYNKALEVDKNQIGILFSLASAYQSIGNFEKAIKISKQIIDNNPNFTSAHKFLSSLVNYKENEDHLKEMEKIYNKNAISKEQKIDLSFALGKPYEDIENYKKSFYYLEQGNKLKFEKLRYNLGSDEKLFNSIISAFENIEMSEYKLNTKNKKIIFICGMPRSGTTLVEQIISAHKDVTGAGELIYLQKGIYDKLIRKNLFIKENLVEEINSKENYIAKEYYKLLNLHKIDSQHVTDKAPQNFRWIGLIKMFFPNSKIILCTRDPKDNCLSLFKNNFASNDMGWTYNQEDIVGYYKLYLKLINFWKLKIQDNIYEANYENITKNKEQEIKKIIKFCDLKWDPACLNHHKNNKTPIKTVSVSQARKPIYTSSVNSNIFYSKELKKMFSLLDDI